MMDVEDVRIYAYYRHDDRPVMAMVCGLPGSGKSTFAKELAEEMNAAVFSSDALREEMFGDSQNQGNNQKLFRELHKRIKECLKSGKSAVYDATNVNSKKRRAFLNELKNIRCNKMCVIMATPYEQCLENNKNRDRVVPEYVIEQMYRKWQTPYWFEGWESFKICYWDGSKGSIFEPDLIDCLSEYNQYNPHHSLTLGEHLIQTANNFCSKYPFAFKFPLRFNIYEHQAVIWACILHDIGKPKVETFTDCKGKKTDVAHYYNHENVGAYDSLFVEDYRADFNCILTVSALITWHMQPYFWERDNNEKLHKKYRNIFGEEFYNCLMALHEADKAAH